MPDSVTTQTILDGSRKVVMKFTNVSDGTGEAAVTKVDLAALTPIPDGIKISGVRYTCDGMMVQMLWEATADVLAYTLGGEGEIDFRPVGGLINNAGTGKTGNILFTTSGHTAGDSYSIILEMDKR